MNAVITIDCNAKKEIIFELDKLFGINEETIYPDFLGYLQANNARKPLKIKTAQDHFDIAADFLKKGEYQQAINHYTKSLAIDKDQWKAHLGMARCMRLSTKYSDALPNALEAKRIAANELSICNELGLIYTFLRNFTAAKEAWQPIERDIITNKANHIYLSNLGWMYLCFLEIDKARLYLNMAMLSGKPYHPAINLGHCYLLEGNEVKAIENYNISMSFAKTESTFWASFDLDYKIIEMKKKGITDAVVSRLKPLIAKR